MSFKVGDVTASKKLEPVLVWCNCLGILPYYDPKSGNFKNKKLVLLFVLVVVLGMQGIRWGRFILSRINNGAGTYILTFGNQACMTVLLLVMISGPVRWKLEDVGKIFRYFNYVDANVQVKPSMNPKWPFIIGNIILVVYWFYQGFFEYFRLEVFLNMISIVHQYNYFFNSTIFQYLLMDCVLKRLRCVAFPPPDSIEQDAVLAEKVKVMMKLHCALCEILEIYRGLFGYHLYFTAVFINLRFLDVLHYILVNDKDTFYNIFTEAVPTTILLTQYLIIPIKSEDVKKALKSFERKCDLLLNQYQDHPLTSKRIDRLCHQARHPPIFSAAGFFPVDYSMIFTNINLFVSYIVVMLGFINKSSSDSATTEK